MHATYRTHYNPCFWTACWNDEYLRQIEAGETIKKRPREYKVYCLSPKSGNIFSQSTSKIFYEEGTGLSYFDNEDVLDFTKRNFPGEYDGIVKYYEEKGEELLLLDFENVFKALEDSIRDYLFKLIKDKSITTTEEKTHIAMFVLLQHMRNPKLLNPWIKEFSQDKYPRFEFFVNFRHFLQDADSLYSAALPIVTAKWTLFKSEESRFPYVTFLF